MKQDYKQQYEEPDSQILFIIKTLLLCPTIGPISWVLAVMFLSFGG